MRYLIATLIALTLVIGATPAQAAPKGPCRGLSVRQTIICAEHIWPVPGGVHYALYVASRESNLLPFVTSSNGCCYGLWQIHRDHMPSWPNALMRLPYWSRWFPNLVRDDPNMLYKHRFATFLAIRYAHFIGWQPWGG